MRTLIVLNLLVLGLGTANAEVRVHHVFDNNTVLQRGNPVKVWGWAEKGEAVAVEFGDQKAQTKADDKGAWAVELGPMQASSEGRRLIVKGAANTVEYENIVVGDVWLCGGQSNMEDVLESIYHGDVEVASAHHPLIRLMTIPVKATPDRREDFERINEFNSWTNRHEQKGSWFVCSPDTVNRFSAIGYIFGRRIHLASQVPIGLIDNAVGGTTVEGWTSRESLQTIPEARPLLEEWDGKIADWDAEQDLADRIKRWEQDTERRKARGEQPRPKPDDLRLGPAFDRNNPGASYNAMLASFGGFALKGIIFNQGYNNALGNTRPNLYAKTFQAMIGDWRSAFNDDALPFGIVELTAGAPPQTLDNFELKMIDAAPYIREAQFKAYRDLENMGWACAYDQQFYPARATFAVKGQDQHGRDQFDNKKVEVWSPFVSEPKAVRYAWARCPLGNLANSAHHERFIPVPSFRTDNWGWEDAPFGPDERSVTSRRWHEARQQAEAHMKKRKFQEAEARFRELAAQASGEVE